MMSIKRPPMILWYDKTTSATLRAVAYFCDGDGRISKIQLLSQDDGNRMKCMIRSFAKCQRFAEGSERGFLSVCSAALVRRG